MHLQHFGANDWSRHLHQFFAHKTQVENTDFFFILIAYRFLRVIFYKKHQFVDIMIPYPSYFVHLIL